MTDDRPFHLGFLTHLAPQLPPRELLTAGIDLFVAAEELGFDSGWVAQHHLGPLEGTLPSPFVLLGAVAARTSRIRLGTAIVNLALDDPIRVAEDAAVLDAISGGRVELGIGSGNPEPGVFAAFGKDVAARRDLFTTGSARLRAALQGEDLGGGLTLRPAAPGLAGRIWDSPLDPDRVRTAGAAGDGVLLGIGPASSAQLDLARAYRAAGGDRLAVVHSAFFGADRDQVADRLWPIVSEQSLAYYQHAGWVGVDPAPAELLAAMNVHHGTVDDVVASIAREPVIDLASDLVLALEVRTSTPAEALAALETIASEVAPRLGWHPAAAPAVTR
ncbi:LLM class flavin-dependent oxidoreductase [uncultured Amnibacterium sp.]|uniref:LLM class flavin-dependent oxidoreductase n=1 Tax=uncultured Amnibacterium sp. TaxID=1631851 RepID=UPI0035C9A587